MSKVDSAIPQAGKPDATKLAAIDADTLARYVVDPTHPWWRRRPCVEALKGRVPEDHVPGLLDRIRDPEDTSEVRIALLALLGDRSELLPYLQTITRDASCAIYENALAARGRAGDLTAAPELALCAAGTWMARVQHGEQGLDALIDRHGVAVVEHAVGTTTIEGRIFANRVRGRERSDLTAALADPDTGVARRAVELIIKTGVPDDDHLLDHVVTGSTLEARLWAIYALHRRGHDVRELWHALESPRIAVPGLPEEMRAAILREYPGELATDPRWLLERVCAPGPTPPDEEVLLARAVAALRSAGLAAGEPVSAGDANKQGAGTFYEVSSTNGLILVSTLGMFATGGYDDWSGPARERAVLEAAGFAWVDEALGALLVPRLPVYFFGCRDPQSVHALLFYWQD